MHNSYADVLESYMIAEEGLFSKLKDKFKKKSKNNPITVTEPKKNSVEYSEYESYIENIYLKIPNNIIQKELSLRKRELNKIRQMASICVKTLNKPAVYGFIPSSKLKYDTDEADFINPKGSEILFDLGQSVNIFSCNGTDYMNQTTGNKYVILKNPDDKYGKVTDEWIELNNEFLREFEKVGSKLIDQIKKSNFQCIKECDFDGDKDEIFIYANLKPSNEFLDTIKEYGYMDWDSYKRSK